MVYLVCTKAVPTCCNSVLRQISLVGSDLKSVNESIPCTGKERRRTMSRDAVAYNSALNDLRKKNRNPSGLHPDKRLLAETVPLILLSL